MYNNKKYKPATTSINVNKSYEGERIEEKIQRIVNNKEPITDGAPLIYQERKDGVMAEYNPRTDKWEIAVDAMTKVQKSKVAKREERLKLADEAKQNMDKEAKSETKNETGGQSTAGTGGTGESK